MKFIEINQFLMSFCNAFFRYCYTAPPVQKNSVNASQMSTTL